MSINGKLFAGQLVSTFFHFFHDDLSDDDMHSLETENRLRQSTEDRKDTFEFFHSNIDQINFNNLFLVKYLLFKEQSF